MNVNNEDSSGLSFLFSQLEIDENAAPDTKDEVWISKFLTEKSKISPKDETIQRIAKAIQSSETLKGLIKERYISGKRLGGWATDGSKAYTDISTGDIWMAKTDKGTELMTLGYECMNSKNSYLYKKIGIRHAYDESSSKENREQFAKEILGVEAQAMYIKCKLAKELDMKTNVKEHYLKIAEDDKLKESEKIEKLTEAMIKHGKVHHVKPAFEFYKGERYDEITKYYKEQVKKGLII